MKGNEMTKITVCTTQDFTMTMQKFEDVVDSFKSEPHRWFSVNSEDGIARFGFEMRNEKGFWITETIKIESK